jgi:hypothetical protein
MRGVYPGTGIAFNRPGTTPIYGEVTAVACGTVIWRELIEDGTGYRYGAEITTGRDQFHLIDVVA